MALSDEISTLNFNLCEKQTVSSFYLPNTSFLCKFPDVERFKVIRQIEIKTDTLDNQLSKNGIDDIDFIKIDTQGYKRSILRGGVNCITKAIGLEIEVEFAQLYKSQPLFNDVDKFVRENGFELFDIKRYFWKRKQSNLFEHKKGQLIFADTLYFKLPEDIINLKEIDEKFLSRAFCIYLSYGYLELAEELFQLLKKKELISIDSINNFQKILSTLSKNSILPNFRGKSRIRKIILEMANVFSQNSPFYGTDESIGN